MDSDPGAEILAFPVICVTVPCLVWIGIHTASQDANYRLTATSGHNQEQNIGVKQMSKFKHVCPVLGLCEYILCSDNEHIGTGLVLQQLIALHPND